MDEERLSVMIRKSGTGNQGSFRELYEFLIDRVFAFVRHRTSNEDDAVDITQEVFIDLYNALSNFEYRSPGQFHGFVFLIAKRKLAKHYRKTKVEFTERVDVENEDALPGSGEETFETDEMNRLLETLPEQTRDIVVLHHWSQYTFAEIASFMKMKESAVRVRHHRAMQQLSDVLTLQRETV